MYVFLCEFSHSFIIFSLAAVSAIYLIQPDLSIAVYLCCSCINYSKVLSTFMLSSRMIFGFLFAFSVYIFIFDKSNSFHGMRHGGTTSTTFVSFQNVVLWLWIATQ